ncbi:hypothetical protein KC332_g5805 [Hortaea werneckii]|uniref:Uncharacterized protein n=1 Tax=Hortaea werneckii EXF-2000 TaxID=1157616 RepID=A0A1Z5SVM4_HORWE|nr:hypothetical protein KC358_g5697 [Hortaea werneckii]OTA24862.1 hypothetical protein BTJ68_12910 [Hortaea werneckii EXF-2000]KAI6936859.1 hypothetical protein KC348_g5891 [Hortaea werneckii]KAI6937503.1 hypothetical protein KC341_g5529 [Hortaea werneckii]KAI6973058.1 hypothetical protein KC321_g5880 [Hortaea werneckii]
MSDRIPSDAGRRSIPRSNRLSTEESLAQKSDRLIRIAEHQEQETLLLNTLDPLYEALGYAAARKASKNQAAMLMFIDLVTTEVLQQSLSKPHLKGARERVSKGSASNYGRPNIDGRAPIPVRAAPLVQPPSSFGGKSDREREAGRNSSAGAASRPQLFTEEDLRAEEEEEEASRARMGF